MYMNEVPAPNRRVLSLQFRLSPSRLNGTQPLPETPTNPVALLIDGENIFSSHLVPEMLEVAAKMGIVTIRRVYGNWRNNEMDFNWRDNSIKYALEPAHSIKGRDKEKKERNRQEKSGDKPKNGSDISLVIGAMDLLYHHGIKHFCLVTGDSDYLPLVMRLREAGCTVVGIGKPDTYPSMRTSYNEFFTTDDLEVVHSSLRSKTAPLELPPLVTSNTDSVKRQPVSAPLRLETASVDAILGAIAMPAVPSADETLDELLVRAYRRLLERPKYKDLPDNAKWVYMPDFGDSIKGLNPDYKTAYEGEIKGMKPSDYIKKRSDLFEWKPSITAHQIEVRLRAQDHEHAQTHVPVPNTPIQHALSNAGETQEIPFL